MAARARPIGACDGGAWGRGRLHLAPTESGQVKALLDQAEKELDELAKANTGMQILDTAPGGGPRPTAGVAFLPGPTRFRAAKQVAAYGGFVPRQYPSADGDHRGRITKRGPRALRKLRAECARAMLWYSAWA
jgi:transposase